jgi:hypothetical protein
MMTKLLSKLTLATFALVLTVGGALADAANEATGSSLSTLQMFALSVVGVLLCGLHNLVGGGSDTDDAESSGGDGGGD